jgi:hypothetical protein
MARKAPLAESRIRRGRDVILPSCSHLALTPHGGVSQIECLAVPLGAVKGVRERNCVAGRVQFAANSTISGSGESDSRE